MPRSTLDSSEVPRSTRHVLEGHTDEVWFVQFSPSGSLLASASKDNVVVVWDVTQPSVPKLSELRGAAWLRRGGLEYTRVHTTLVWGLLDPAAFGRARSRREVRELNAFGDVLVAGGTLFTDIVQRMIVSGFCRMPFPL